MKYRSYLIHGGIALVAIILLLVNRGFFRAEDAAGRLLAAADSFSAVALFFVCFGALVWISSTGVFDMLGYAIKKGAHYLIPGMVKMDAEDFYEYKLEKKDKKQKVAYNVILVVGLVLLVISFILIFFWYQVS